MRIFEITNNNDFIQIYVDRAKKIIDNYFAKPDANKQFDPRQMLNQVARVAYRPKPEHKVPSKDVEGVGERVAKKLMQMDELLDYIRQKQA